MAETDLKVIACAITCCTSSYLMNLSEQIMPGKQEKAHILEWTV